MSEFKKYCDIDRLGKSENSQLVSNPEDEIIIEEKVDGANFSFFVGEDNEVHFCSRNNDLTEKNDEGNFKIYCDYLRDLLEREI